MKGKMRGTKGITLIALVVTIVILLILAGVSLNLVLSNNGIVNKAKDAKNKTKESNAKEEVVLILGDWSMENIINDTDLKDFLDQKVEEGILDGVEETDEGYDIEKDGYIVSVDKDGNIIGEPSKTGPRPVITAIKVVASSDGTGGHLPAKSVADGETVYIVFTASIEGGEITSITRDGTAVTLPYAVTDNGKYNFTVAGTVDGETRTRSITVTVNQFDTEIEVGDYVNYKYDDAENYVLTSATSGSTSNPLDGIPQTKNLKWKILNINEDGSMDLISATPTSTDVYFSGALGYNNGVYLINDICAEQYSNASLGVTARNLTIEDIEARMNNAGITARNEYTSDGVKYGDTKTYTSSSYRYYPNLYAQENGSGINTTTVKTDGIGVSDPYYAEPTDETSSQADANGLTITKTYYNLGSTTPTSYFDDSNVYSMIFGTGSYFWLASRYSYNDATGSYAYFGLRRVNSASLYGISVFYSYNYAGNDYKRLRPVVSLGSNVVDTTLGRDANGAWQIKTK